MKTTARATCSHKGCTESTFWSYDTKREAREGYAYRAKWKCSRHSQPDKVLSTERLTREVVLTAAPHGDLDPAKHRFWKGEGTSGSGFSFSDAHKAHAIDFPIGTKLIITARIELPTE